MTIENHTIELDTRGFCHVIDITEQVRRLVSESGVASGQVLVSVIGSTAGVTTVEYEPGLEKDLQDFFNRLIPPTLDYHHEQTWHDGNGFSHVRASLLKPSLTFPIMDADLRIGTWQQIVLLDFDNRPRRRRVAVQVMGQ